MTDGSPSLFDRVLDTSPDTNDNRIVFPWHRGKKTHVTTYFHESFSDGKIKQNHIDELIDSLKESEYWDPELPAGT
jgi:hypothetical protein